MGAVSWVVGGLVAVLVARMIAAGRRSWKGEGAIAVSAAVSSGLVATALDFGGWNELDWRAAGFATLVAFAAIALLRLFRLLAR